MKTKSQVVLSALFGRLSGGMWLMVLAIFLFLFAVPDVQADKVSTYCKKQLSLTKKCATKKYYSRHVNKCNAAFSGYAAKCKKNCSDTSGPVCAWPPSPPCPKGYNCAAIMPPPKTYRSECEMVAAKATLYHYGECASDPIGVCPDVVDYVCGQPPSPPRPPCTEGKMCPQYMPLAPVSYLNECEMLAAGATLISRGLCCDLSPTMEGENYVCGLPPTPMFAPCYSGDCKPVTYEVRPTTYRSLCGLALSRATFLYRGPCKE